jgi:hypothetical protein
MPSWWEGDVHLPLLQAPVIQKATLWLACSQTNCLPCKGMRCRDYAVEGFAGYVGQVKNFCGDVDTSDAKAQCSAGQIAMRVSFANFCMFMLHAIATLGMKVSWV